MEEADISNPNPRDPLTDAASIMGITRKALSELVNEKTSCSPQMALRIAQVTRTSAESWLIMQIKLDIWKASQKKNLAVKGVFAV